MKQGLISFRGIALMLLAGAILADAAPRNPDYQEGLDAFLVDGSSKKKTSRSSRKAPQKSAAESARGKYWVTSTGKTHASHCRYYGTTRYGYYTDTPSGDNCKLCGGARQ